MERTRARLLFPPHMDPKMDHPKRTEFLGLWRSVWPALLSRGRLNPRYMEEAADSSGPFFFSGTGSFALGPSE